MPSKTIDPTEKMPVVGWPLTIYETKYTNVKAGIAFMNITRRKNITYLNMMITPTYKDDTGTAYMDQLRVRIPIGMLNKFNSILKKNGWLAYREKKARRWRVDVYPGVKT